MICKEDYKRHGNTYLAGKAYDIDAATAKADEAYMGVDLWDGSKSEAKRKAVQKKGKGKK